MTQDDEHEFIDLVIAFAKEKSMTITNVIDATKKAVACMKDNAVLGKELPDSDSSSEN